jgi:hypothetical protein
MLKAVLERSAQPELQPTPMASSQHTKRHLNIRDAKFPSVSGEGIKLDIGLSILGPSTL